MKIANEIGYSILIPICESLGALALRGRHSEDQRIVGLVGLVEMVPMDLELFQAEELRGSCRSLEVECKQQEQTRFVLPVE